MSAFGKFKDLISSKLLSLEGEIREEFVKFEEELGIRKEPENTCADEAPVAAPVPLGIGNDPIPDPALQPTPVHVETVVEAQVVSPIEEATA